MNAKVSIQGVFNITGAGPVVVGKVVEGILKPGMKFEVSGTVMEVKSMERQHQVLTEATAG